MKRILSCLLILLIAYSVYAYYPLMISFYRSSSGLKSYDSEKYGFSFTYPAGYFLEEKEIGDGHRYRYLISLTDDTEENRLVREGKSPGREGPAAITLEIFQNNLDNLKLEDWLTGTGYSNLKLSDGNFSRIKISGADAVAYKWSGLYEADAVAFQHAGNIISVTATYISPDDRIRKDFQDIIRSLILK